MKTMINIKADKEVKAQARKIAQGLGFSLSALINAFLKQFIRERTVCFTATPTMSKELEALIEEAEKDFKNNKSLSPVLSGSKEIEKYLSRL